MEAFLPRATVNVFTQRQMRRISYFVLSHDGHDRPLLTRPFNLTLIGR
jgi:hypothetical protein